MYLEFIGHACVVLEASDGTRLVIDPYEPGGFDGKMNYRPLDRRIDAVACTHDHPDHCAVDALRGRPVRLDERRPTFGPFEIGRVRASHDEYGGRRRGGQVDCLHIEAEGCRIVHAADVGQSPTRALVDALRPIDVLVVPVGGFFTIGAAQAWEWARRLGAPIVVPCHQKTERCQLPIRHEHNFLAHRPGRIRRKAGSRIELREGMLTFEQRWYALQPSG